ncbi:kelch-like protein 10 [Saccostrea cucullata]|uniref:kelch-like protein 10 n=1 Tax=Saccostrea cuccullata TaxID=36930 RepID=UPI002ED19D5D
MTDFQVCSVYDMDPQTQLHEMRLQGIFCDAYIKIPDENTRLPVHRNVMASCSHYFRSLFTSGLKESEQNEISIFGVSANTMNQIIQYAYIRKAIITPDNVEDLLAASDRFHVFGLLKECTHYLYEQISPENCIGIFKFARFYNCEHLSRKAWEYIVRNFKDIVEKSQEYLQLHVDDLKEILNDDDLSVRNESEVFLAIQRWIDYDQRERKEKYSDLLKSMRFCFVNVDFFQTKIQRNKTLVNLRDCKKLINRVSNLMRIFYESPFIVDDDNVLLRPRVPPEIIFTVGGWSSSGVVDTIEAYDKNVDRWYVTKQSMPCSRAYHGTVFMDGHIYIVGGFDGNQYLNSVYCFSPDEKNWEERAPMYIMRCYVSAVELNGIIYACGGFDGRNRQDSVEKYNPIKNQWTHVQPMWRKRSDAGATALDGKIYIAGGFDGTSCLDSAEVYDPTVNQWTMLAEMTSRRSGVVLVALQKELIALGGYNGSDRLSSVERYSWATRSWFPMGSMIQGRSNFAAVIMDGKIVAIGGYDGSTTSPNAEEYDPAKKAWRRLYPLNYGRSAVSACLVTRIRSGRDFTYHGLAHDENL